MQQAVKAPIHLWIIGVLSFLWNCVGAFDYTATQLDFKAYTNQTPPEVLDWVNGFPAWAVAVWAIGVWGALLGSASLLLRKSWAVWLFGASLIGLAINSLYTYGISNGAEVMGEGAGTFTAVIAVIAIALLFYARAMEKRGVLN